MKKWKRILSVGLTAAMAGALLAGCGTGDSSSDETSEAGTTAESTEASDDVEVEDTGFEPETTYTIGYNYYGQGSYALTTLANNEEYVIKTFGNDVIATSDDFQVDKIVQDIENMIAAGCDGLAIWLPADALYPTVIEMCEEAQVPYVFVDKVPSDEDVIAQLQEAEYFAGAVGPANAEYGTLIAEFAIEQGYTSCIITTGAQGDPTDTPRIEAFTEVFEAAGGTIEEIVYSDSLDAIQSNTENSLTAHQVDFVYATGSEYGTSGANAILNLGLDTKVLTSGLDSDVLEMLNDESNPVEFVNGDYWISGLMAMVALQNYLDGTPLTDADGNMVWVDDIMPFEVASEDYADFVATFIDDFCYSESEIQAMSGKYNADFDYDAFIEIIDSYSLEERMAAK